MYFSNNRLLLLTASLDPNIVLGLKLAILKSNLAIVSFIVMLDLGHGDRSHGRRRRRRVVDSLSLSAGKVLLPVLLVVLGDLDLVLLGLGESLSVRSRGSA